MIDEYDPNIHSQKAMCIRMALEAGLSQEDAELACSTVPGRGMLEGDAEPTPRTECANQNFDVADIFPGLNFASERQVPTVPEVKKDCFGTEKSKTCKGDCKPTCLKAYLSTVYVNPAERDRMRIKTIVDLLEESKVVVARSDRREKDKKQEVIKIVDSYHVDELTGYVQKYVARGKTKEEAEYLAKTEYKEVHGRFTIGNPYGKLRDEILKEQGEK